MSNEHNWEPFDNTFQNRHPDRRWRAITDRVKGCNYGKSMACDPRAVTALWFCRSLSVEPDRIHIPLSVSPTDLADISEAWKIYTRPDYRRTRDLLEACCYTPLATVEIAKRLNLQPAVVEWYEYLFHDIRRLLEYPMLVLASEHLLGRLHTSEGKADESLLWKYVAFQVGADAFFRMVAGPQSFVPEDWVWVCHEIRQRYAIATLEAAMGVRPSSKNAVDLADLELRFSKSVASREKTDNCEEVASSIAALISDMAIKTGPD